MLFITLVDAINTFPLSLVSINGTSTILLPPTIALSSTKLPTLDMLINLCLINVSA